MNPRILKKLCKRIFDMGHPIAKGAWVDDEDSNGGSYIGSYLWPEKRINATAKQKRRHYMTKTTISKIYVVGGGLDYWGEAEDPIDLLSLASNHVLWKIGTPRKCLMRDENGDVVDEVDGWPETKKRITGKLVIRVLRDEMQEKENNQ